MSHKPDKELKNTLAALLENRPEIIFAVLYGSAATDQTYQDLDIGLFVDRDVLPLAQELHYTSTLADKLEEAVALPVDVRVINEAPLPFRYNVSKGVPLVVNDEKIFTQFLERTWDKYLDFHPVAMQYLKELQ